MGEVELLMLKAAARVCLTSILVLNTQQGALFAQESGPRSARVLAGDFLAIQAAMPEINKYNVKDLNGYFFHVVDGRVPEQITVTIMDVNEQISCRGLCGPKPAVTVVLNKSDLRVISSSFNR